MGACLSCMPKKPQEAQTNVRVVHLNGYVEEFEYPIMVGELTGGGKPPKHFVCTPTQLLSTGYKPLKQDTLLQLGQIYFLLPYSALQSDASPMDLAAVVRKLTALGRSGSKRSSNEGSFGRSGQMSPMNCASPVWSSNYSSSPGRGSPGRFTEDAEGSPSRMEMMYGAQRSTRARSWKPLLEPISERQFNKRTESDLQERQVEVAKYVNKVIKLDEIKKFN